MRRPVHQVQLAGCHDETGLTPPVFRYRLALRPHLHPWGDVAVNVNGGGRSHEPVIGNTTTYDVVQFVCVCVFVCACVLCVRARANVIM